MKIKFDDGITPEIIAGLVGSYFDALKACIDDADREAKEKACEEDPFPHDARVIYRMAYDMLANRLCTITDDLDDVDMTGDFFYEGRQRLKNLDNKEAGEEPVANLKTA